MIWVGFVEIFFSIISPFTEPQILTNDGHVLDEVEEETQGDVTPAHRPQVLNIHRELHLGYGSKDHLHTITGGKIDNKTLRTKTALSTLPVSIASFSISRCPFLSPESFLLRTELFFLTLTLQTENIYNGLGEHKTALLQ